MTHKQIHLKHKPMASPKSLKARLRHTHSVIAGLEDTIAILWDVINEVVHSMTYMNARVKQAISVQQKIRKGPHAYDPDQPGADRDALHRKIQDVLQTRD